MHIHYFNYNKRVLQTTYWITCISPIYLSV